MDTWEKVVHVQSSLVPSQWFSVKKLRVLESKIQSKELQEISISSDGVRNCKIPDVMTLMRCLLF